MNPKYYKVCWYEYHDPMNWEGVKQLRECVFNPPYSLIHLIKKAEVICRPDLNEHDGWYECDITIKFFAVDVDDAKKMVEQFGCNTSDFIFTCFEKVKGKWVRAFTEEGIDD